MFVRELLAELDLGNSVAEFDADLDAYFVETQTFRALVRGGVDVVAGDKGTGKTALYRILRDRFKELPELRGIEILPAFNPTGNPVFQRLAQLEILTEAQYSTVWKSYFLSLVGNWLLEAAEGLETDKLVALDRTLRAIGLRSTDESASNIFSKLINLVKQRLRVRTVEGGLGLTEAGMPIINGRVEFADLAEDPDGAQEIIYHEDAFQILNEALAELDGNVWVVLDRLDEAFQGYSAMETPALRALLRTYLDLLEFDRIKLKLFVRKDLFRKVVHGGFVNLTHVNAKRLDIVWDEEDLKALLCNRIRRDEDFMKRMQIEGPLSDDQIFNLLFPAQIDAGPRKPTTWSWMMSRIRDGNDTKPPRNLVDLVKKAQEAQQRMEERAAREYHTGAPLIEADAVRRALVRLSEDRVNDTLLAEASELAPMLERFRDGKAEHNAATLATLLEVDEREVRTIVKPLIEIGFLEEIGEAYKVPMLYRDGLNISQGKAYAQADAPQTES